MGQRAPNSTALPRFAIFLTLLVCGLGVGRGRAAEPVSFRNEVMAVLSRAGCNQGTCHGNQNGKNGFKLSLRGEDPAFDLTALTRDSLGRRANPHRPADSLILLKATATIPHEGGQRFAVNSPEYALLSRWIADAMPPDPAGTPTLHQLLVTPRSQVLTEPAAPLQVSVRARFDDGSVRDVTRLAVFEPSNQSVTVTPEGQVYRNPDVSPGFAEASVLVRYLDRQATVQLAFVPSRPAFAWPALPEAHAVDRHVYARLRDLRMLPSPPAADSVFLRRVHLDVLGILPTATEAREFLADPRPDKRARLIDRLVERPEFADFWALKWSDLLRNEEKVLDRKGVQTFHRWIRQSIAEGKPLNEFARELIAARGSTYSQPEANFYRALRDPASRAEATAQVFLGIRLQCAKCHNHPFDRWTQDDYYGLTAFFARVQYRIVENNRRDRFDKHEFDGEQVVWQDREGEVQHPRTGVTLPPHFPGGTTPQLAPGADRLQALAAWLASPNNPFFARVQVNRVWYHLFGRGIVDPNDDFRASNPPSNGPLLEALTQDFIAHRFDLRHLVRTIATSRTYQASAVPNETNRADQTNFSHALVRPLAAEPLLDALAQVTGVAPKFNGYPRGLRAGQLPGVRPFRDRDMRPTSGEMFLRQFGKPERLLTCECERSEDTTLGQAFQLISGEMLNRMLTEPDNRLAQLLASGQSDRAMIEEFYLAALCRLPTAAELRAGLGLLERAADRRAGLEDVVWALVNAKAFLLRQ